MSKKTYLYDIAFIRILLIFLLVLYHSFAPFCGTWDQIKGVNTSDYSLYYWIGWLTHGFQLETMTFISGLLFAYAIENNTKKNNFDYCVLKKVKRIILPCVIFGTLYYFLFLDTTMPTLDIFFTIMNGCGHLWYLPMIFWCFVLTFILEKYIPFTNNRKKVYTILFIAFCTACIPLFFSIPFGIGKMTLYYLYFFLGFNYKMVQRILLLNNRIFIILPLLYIFLIAVYLLLSKTTEYPTCINYFLHIIGHACQIAASLFMLLFLYFIANTKTITSFLSNKPILVKISGYCYGVYIVQQFILVYLYYFTFLPLSLDIRIVPWCFFAISLIGSILICDLLLKTRIGRYMIG